MRAGPYRKLTAACDGTRDMAPVAAVSEGGAMAAIAITTRKRSRGSPAARVRMSCCWPLAGLSPGRIGAVPVHRQALAQPEPADVPGKHILNPLQGFLVGGLGAQQQPVHELAVIVH